MTKARRPKTPARASRRKPMVQPTVEVLHIFISEGHNHFFRHGKPIGDNPAISVDAAECVAGRGLKGDRFYNFKKDYKGQITFFASEVYDELCIILGVDDKSTAAFRRNVITRGIDLNTLIGKEFEIQGIRFLGTGECTPCYWMDQSFGPGAEAALKGRGGLRAKILTDGTLQVTKKVSPKQKGRT